MSNRQQASRAPSADRRRLAGAKAEDQMSFYLNREFGKDDGVHIINDLRLVDTEQPEHDGRPGVCQIDHLVIHRWGVIIVESKSVTDEVSVRDDGAGGDEWTRRYKGRDNGFASPLEQARRQGDFLRAFLNGHGEQLLSKRAMGLRTLAKVISGSEQRGFRNMPVQVVVAVSDSGKIKRVNKWEPPSKPFRSFVAKADQVPKHIKDEIKHHRRNSGMTGSLSDNYGMWSMKPEETEAVEAFLIEHNTPHAAAPSAPSPPKPRSTPSPPTAQAATPAPKAAATPACKSCGGANLTARWGKYGYYWSCADCSKNTPMPTVCSACGAEGARGKTVRIRKDGPKYFRSCEACGIEVRVWMEA